MMHAMKKYVEENRHIVEDDQWKKPAKEGGGEMNLQFVNRHRSWFYSAGMALFIALWLISGTFGDNDSSEIAVSATSTSIENPRNKVRVRTQSAESITRTIVVNGKTAPARSCRTRRRD